MTVFCNFFKNYSKDFDETWSECRGERYRADAKKPQVKIFFPFSRYSSTKLRFLDDPKKSKKKILSKFPNGPIRKVNMLKSKFDDIFVPVPL